MSFKGSIVRGAGKQEVIGEILESVTLNTVRKVLPDSAIEDACRSTGYEFRRRILSPVVVVLHMVMTALSSESSFAGSWRNVWSQLAGVFPGAAGKSPGTGALSKARGRLPLEVFRRLFSWVGEHLQRQSEQIDHWRGLRPVLVDGTNLSMSANAELFEAFDHGRGKHGPFRYPVCRVVTLALANSLSIVAYNLGGYLTSEKRLLLDMLDSLSEGDLLVGDRGFAAANLYVQYLRSGLQFLTRAHQCLKIGRLPRLVSYSNTDFLTRLKITPANIKADPSLPARVSARVIGVKARVRGKHQMIWLVTSLLDAKAYPASEIADMYLKRWRIEGCIRDLKASMGAKVLRSETAQGVIKEIAARMIAHNILRSIILEAAIEHDLDPLRISFINAMRTVVCFAASMAHAPAFRLPGIYQAMLREIAANLVPERSGRLEPRAVRREGKSYSALRCSRAEWRAQQSA